MGRKKNPNQYFGPVEEQAIIDYQNAITMEEKNIIFTKYLYIPITKLVDAVVKKYHGYIGSCGMEELQARALIHVLSTIQGFDGTRIGKNGQPARAYSYLGTVCKHFCHNHSETAYKKESIIDDVTSYNTDYIDEQLKTHYLIDNEEEPIDFLEKFFKKISDDIKLELEHNKKLKVNEIKVGDCIVSILENYKDIFPEDVAQDFEYTKKGKLKKLKYTNIYAKNKILYIIKDQTGLSSKEIAPAMKVFKSFYNISKQNILSEED